ncbi:hypothetical protein QYF61_003879, partial [Mycteria americana]
MEQIQRSSVKMITGPEHVIRGEADRAEMFSLEMKTLRGILSMHQPCGVRPPALRETSKLPSAGWHGAREHGWRHGSVKQQENNYGNGRNIMYSAGKNILQSHFLGISGGIALKGLWSKDKSTLDKVHLEASVAVDEVHAAAVLRHRHSDDSLEIKYEALEVEGQLMDDVDDGAPRGVAKVRKAYPPRITTTSTRKKRRVTVV